MSDSNRYYLHQSSRYAVVPFQPAVVRITGDTRVTDAWYAIYAGINEPACIGTATFAPTFKDRLRLFFSRRWLVALYVPQSEVRTITDYAIGDRHYGLVPGLPEIARELPDHNQTEAQAFCDELNAQYNKNPGVVRRDTPMTMPSTKVVGLAQTAMDQTGRDKAEMFFQAHPLGFTDVGRGYKSDWVPVEFPAQRPGPDVGFYPGLVNALLIVALFVLGLTAWLAFKPL